MLVFLILFLSSAQATYYGTYTSGGEVSTYACYKSNGWSDFHMLDVFTYNNQINTNFYQYAANAHAAGFTTSQFDLFFTLGPLIGTFDALVEQMNTIINTNNVQFNIMWLDIDGQGWYTIQTLNEDSLRHELDLLLKYYPKVGVRVTKDFWNKTFTNTFTYDRSNEILLWDNTQTGKTFEKYGWWTTPNMSYYTSQTMCGSYKFEYKRNNIL
ncbi:lysozyme, putative [Entamoeba invadens IP1]|uniref:Lysozyme, putative n=1 Tax=Entamoeba invadens IP1 TaxID=370355 RepID=A0A0A1U8D6_ENTIV|nr:lysozyme, putative [Entamoeba invadens IP1]ELP91174.1 lysozyme, putative [Entamoeba invadens IP1]|eukprot:XP_004257945.1 lysozyme, putative [Entamoeba invadens IP1]